MDNTTPQFLKNLWYVAATSSDIKRHKTIAKQLLGKIVLLGRDEHGQVFAMNNVCPHRGVPLTDGKFDGREIECCYHGWRFNTQGTCTKIPSLVPGQSIDVNRIQVTAYPCREQNGLVWIYMADDTHPQPAEQVPLPTDGFLTTEHYDLKVHRLFPCDIDHATIGLMDPAHGPFVHQSWWWRKPKSIHEKHKPFAPYKLGFQMVQHKPSKNSKAYKALAKDISTEITFQLPGCRIERIQFGDKQLFNLTTLTPIDEKNTLIRNFIFSPFSWFPLIKPIIKKFALSFIDQDLRVIIKQQKGLSANPKLMLINDADMQAKWYYRLKYEFTTAQHEGRPFVNPVEETTLKWCS